MNLTLSQAAERLGKTRRQIRYLIQQGRLEAHKDGGRWVVDSERLPISEAQREAQARQAGRLREAVEAVLEPPARGRYSVRDLKAVAVGVPLYQRCLRILGEESPATRELGLGLEQLAIGYHRYGWSEKRDAYRSARDAASRAAMALLLAEHPEAGELLDRIEQELMPAITGVLRRTERRGEKR